MANPLSGDWAEALQSEFDAPYMKALKGHLAREKAARKVIYPHSADWFHAFHMTPLAEVKVVILGQDPYHGPGQAHGLCFSVQRGTAVPPSLANIYKELHSDAVDFRRVTHGCLDAWASQGVLLLNSVLTVEQGNAASHRGLGWETFTDRAIEVVSREAAPCVFMLWGGYAQKKKALIDSQRHLVLEAPHPSPLSAHRGFFGTGHFSRANAFLSENGRTPVNWQLPD